MKPSIQSFIRVSLAGAMLAALAPIAGAQQTPARAPQPVNAADVAFMQGMIGHHGQALTMVALVASRTTRENMRLLAQRIDVSQRDEIKMMQRWLADRGQTVPRVDSAHVGSGHEGMAGMDESMTLMPGMLTRAQLDTLAAQTGTEFDRLFLTDMIQHHEGALTMVKKLFASPGAAQDTQVFEFATNVDADQRAEIARMQGLLSTLPEK